ncbi:transcription initiation factor TFIID [Paenibacillus durus]|uniref:Transcription initiation factor TFIID n=1 Tax=Paenibacillus durus TaxID=44251 RepID=A0A089HMC5_PAEDU|nr:transcription initiation factor TFIID [Paenibacillus durus]
MRSLAMRYAAEYAAREDRLQDQGDKRSSIHYPALFLFVGEKTAPVVRPILDSCRRKWDNAGGVLAVHAVPEGWKPEESGGQQDEALSAAARKAAYGGTAPGVYDDWSGVPASARTDWPAGLLRTMILPQSEGRDPRTVRRELYQEFHGEQRYLAEMNTALRRLTGVIADYGRLYSSFDVIHLSIITRVDDPLNVLLPEITLLTRAVLGQSFKSVQTDLFALISERDQAESFGLSSSAGMAFLRELEGMQSPDYAYTAPLLVTEDGLSIPVSHGPSPLFDLVYVLSDKNERGTSPAGGMEDNYEIISHISLLKNVMRPSGGFGPEQAGYNNMAFKSGIRGSTGRQGYASAGFSGVKRPNRQIALAVLYHTFRRIREEMSRESRLSPRERLELLGLSPDSLRERVRRLLPDKEGILEMTGLMSHGRPSYHELKRLSLREAEELIFGGGGEAYFHSNFASPAAKRLESADPLREWAPLLAAPHGANPAITFFQLAEWTADRDDTGSVLHGLRQHMAGLRAAIASSREELELLYGDSVDRLPFQRVPLMDKRTVRNFIHYLFAEGYGAKYELLLLESELALCTRLESGLESLHSASVQRVKTMERLEEELKAAALDSIGRAESDIGRNIMEYYRVVTDEVIDEIEARRGPGALMSERYMGSLPDLLDQGIVTVLERLIEVCGREILTAAPFALSFEEELLRRANVAAAYDNREVLSKEELFRRLYRSLEEEAAIHVRLFEYTQEHRHEEKYFFGDSGSEFLRYALSADEKTRIYRLGYVHELRRSGVEKLNLMGGFHLEDLLYYRNGRIYYETYLKNGYELHGVDEESLPALR